MVRRAPSKGKHDTYPVRMLYEDGKQFRILATYRREEGNGKVPHSLLRAIYQAIRSVVQGSRIPGPVLHCEALHCTADSLV